MRGNSTSFIVSLSILPTHLVITYLNSDFCNFLVYFEKSAFLNTHIFKRYHLKTFLCIFISVNYCDMCRNRNLNEVIKENMKFMIILIRL